MRYPDAPRLPISEQIGGLWIADPYRWLEDPQDPRTVAWSAEQDVVARSALDSYPGRTALAERLRALLQAGHEGPPRPRGEVGFRVRRDPDQQHPVVVVGSLTDPQTFEVLVDPHRTDPTGATTLDAWDPSPDGRLLAYQLSSGGDEESSLSVLDVATGHVVDGPIDRTRYSPVAWLADSSGFYYVRRLAADSPFDRRVYLHVLGTDPADDTTVFGDGKDPRTYFGVDVSPDGRWLVVSAAIGTAPRDDVWISDLTDPGAGFSLVQEGVDARCHAWVAADGRLYLWTDAQAPRGRLCIADPADPQRWTTLVAEDAEAVLGHVAVLEEEILLAYSRHAVSEVRAVSRETGEHLRDVELPRDRQRARRDLVARGRRRRVVQLHRRAHSPGGPGPARSAVGGGSGNVEVTGVGASVEVTASADGTEIRMQILSRAGQSGPCRPSCPATAGSG